MWLPLQVPLQQSDADVQPSPVARQQVFAVPHDSPEQQSPAAAHAAPTAEHPHLPVAPLHGPVQQSVAVAHAPPAATHPQVCDELHVTPPQQSAVRVQAPPAAEHPHVELDELHTPLQHWPSEVHAVVSFAQHFPNGQALPVQQSVSSEHVPPMAVHPQVFVVRLQIPLQQFWGPTLHGVPSGWQVPQVCDMPS